MNDIAMLCYTMQYYTLLYYTTILSTVDLDDSVAASSPAPPEVADNLGPLEVESSLSQLDDDPKEEEPVRTDPTAAEIMQARIAQGQLDVTTVPIDQRDLDVTEEQLIQEFVQDSCMCDLGPNHTLCSSSITVDHLQAVRCQMADLTHDELDLVVMGQVMAGCFSSATFWKQERSKSFTIFHHNGARICQKTFLFLHTMGYGRFNAIKASFVANGVLPLVHGNTGKSKRKDRLILNQIQDVVQFVMNYDGMCTAVEMSVCVCMQKRERKFETEQDCTTLKLHACVYNYSFS